MFAPETTTVCLLAVCSAMLSWNGLVSAEESLFRSQEHELYTKLLKSSSYDKNVRPVYNSRDVVEVQIKKAVMIILDLDEAAEKLISYGWLYVTWIDLELSWNEDDYPEVSELRVPRDEIWVPDLAVYNGFSLGGEFHDRDLVELYPNGSIVWIPFMHISTFCPLNMNLYPFDEQTCRIVFGSWTHQTHLVNLQLVSQSQDDVEVQVYQAASGFEKYVLQSKDITRNESEHICCPGKFADVTIRVTLTRQSTHATTTANYVASIVCILIPVLFILPPDSEGKFILGAGILVTDTVLLAVLAEVQGTVHRQLTLLGRFCLMSLVLVTLSLIVCALTMNMSSRQGGAGLPKILQKVFINGLGRCLCVDRKLSTTTATRRPPRMHTALTSESQLSYEDMDEPIVATSSCPSSQWRIMAVVLDRAMLILFTMIVFAFLICMKFF